MSVETTFLEPQSGWPASGISALFLYDPKITRTLSNSSALQTLTLTAAPIARYACFIASTAVLATSAAFLTFLMASHVSTLSQFEPILMLTVMLMAITALVLLLTGRIPGTSRKTVLSLTINEDTRRVMVQGSEFPRNEMARIQIISGRWLQGNHVYWLTQYVLVNKSPLGELSIVLAHTTTLHARRWRRVIDSMAHEAGISVQYNRTLGMARCECR